jgi:hypothetical protein
VACLLVDIAPVLEDAVGCVAPGVVVTLSFLLLGARWRSMSSATCLFVKVYYCQFGAGRLDGGDARSSLSRIV